MPGETPHARLQRERCPLPAPPGLRLCLASLQRCSVKSLGMPEHREGLQEVLSSQGMGRICCLGNLSNATVQEFSAMLMETRGGRLERSMVS